MLLTSAVSFIETISTYSDFKEYIIIAIIAITFVIALPRVIAAIKSFTIIWKRISKAQLRKLKLIITI